MIRIAICLLAVIALCQGQDKTPLSYSFMPRCMDIDSVVHIAVGDTSDVVDSTYNEFPSIALPDSGLFVSFSGDTLLLPPGIVFSERKAALYVYYRSAWERQATELYYMKMLVGTYCDKAKDAEFLYQKEIVSLEKKVKRNWFERNAGFIGFGAALLVMAVRDIAVSEMIR
jgi:hypothetical protein